MNELKKNPPLPLPRRRRRTRTIQNKRPWRRYAKGGGGGGSEREQIACMQSKKVVGNLALGSKVVGAWMDGKMGGG